MITKDPQLISGKSFREGKSIAITARTIPRAGRTAITGPLATNGARPLPPQAADPAQRVISAHVLCLTGGWTFAANRT
jgi:hypothetical protein